MMTNNTPDKKDAAFGSFIIPSNISFTSNQQEIIKCVLLRNALLNLNTGNTKWFVSATLMYNYYRWFSVYKTILVSTAQTQLTSVYKIISQHFDIPPENIMILKNEKVLSLVDERKLKNCPVLLTTIDAFKMSLMKKYLRVEDVRFIIFDSVDHVSKRALYKSMNNLLTDYRPYLRLMALVSLPKCPVRRLQDIISMFRLSCYVSDFTEVEDVDPIIVSNGELIASLQDQIDQIYCRFGRKLKEACRLHANLANLTASELKKIKECFLLEKHAHISTVCSKEIEQDFDACIVLLNAIQSLKVLGIYPVDRYLFDNVDKCVRENLLNDAQFQSLQKQFRRILDNDKQKIISHPKLEMLKLKVKEHAQSQRSEHKEASMIIICEDSYQMTDVFNTVRSIGDVDTDAIIMKNDRAFNQFLKGLYNVLIVVNIEKRKLKLIKISLAIFVGMNAFQNFTKTNDSFSLKKYAVIMNEEEAEQFEKMYKSELFNTSKHGQNELEKFCQQFASESPRLLPGDSFPTERFVNISPRNRKSEEKPTKRRNIFNGHLEHVEGRKKKISIRLTDSIKYTDENEDVHSYNSDTADRIFISPIEQSSRSHEDNINNRHELETRRLVERIVENHNSNNNNIFENNYNGSLLTDFIANVSNEVTVLDESEDDLSLNFDCLKLNYVRKFNFNDKMFQKKVRLNNHDEEKKNSLEKLFGRFKSSIITTEKPSTMDSLNISHVDLFERIDPELLNDAFVDIDESNLINPDLTTTTMTTTSDSPVSFRLRAEQSDATPQPASVNNNNNNNNDDKENLLMVLRRSGNKSNDSKTFDRYCVSKTKLLLEQSTPRMMTEDSNDNDEEEEESIIKCKRSINYRRAVTSSPDSSRMIAVKTGANRDKVRKKLVNSFVDNEAVIDNSEDSENELSSSGNTSNYESSFIDDEEHDFSNIQSYYLKTIKSPIMKDKRYLKQHPILVDNTEIFSQDDSYIKDSFCVSDSEL